MSKPQFAILRFAKYKGPEISNIEAHNERTKEKYASNPDVDTSRSHLNFHLITPEQKYRAEAERQIKGAGCRTRSDSVSLKFSPVVETVVKDIKRNPKRMQREAKKQMLEIGIGTKSQQALKLQQEQNKQERKEKSRKRKEAEEQRMFELKQRKKLEENAKK